MTKHDFGKPLDFGASAALGPALDLGSGVDVGAPARPVKPDKHAVPETPAGPVLEAIRARELAQRDSFRDATDSEFWVAVCFETREQKAEFLRRLDLADLGDKYLDGRAVAERLGAPLESRRPAFRAKIPNARLRALVR